MQKRRRQSSTAPAFVEVIVERCEAARPAVIALRVVVPGGVVIDMTNRERLPLAVELLRQLAAQPSC